MMKDRIKVTYDQLPNDLRNLIGKSKFIKAHTVDQGKKIVVWFLDDAIAKQREIEFSVREARVLSRAEREKELPYPEEVNFSDPQFKVVKLYEFESNTDTLHEKYIVYDRAANEKIAECSQAYFMSFLLGADELVRSAINQAAFPEAYKTWSTDEKVVYWIGMVHRARRSVGEQGLDEDAAFSPNLIANMKKTDASIEALLPDVIRGLAKMDMSAPEDMLAAFNRRTGLSIRL